MAGISRLQKIADSLKTYSIGEKIPNPKELIVVVKLPKTTLPIIHTNFRMVFISRQALKHIIERRKDIANDIVSKIPDILINPSKIVDNSSKKSNSYLFVRKDDKIHGIVLEVTKTPDGNRVVSAFPINKRTYEKLKDISGRAASPPLKSPKIQELPQQSLSDV